MNFFWSEFYATVGGSSYILEGEFELCNNMIDWDLNSYDVWLFEICYDITHLQRKAVDEHRMSE